MARVPKLTLPAGASPRTRTFKWLFTGSLEEEEHTHQHPWYMVLWLTGVDYFSTLGYQPGIALLAAGAISPLATLILVGVTLFGAFPVYSQVALRSYAGQGSIAMLEAMLSGWLSKIFVLIMLGFAGTDFVITMTLSAADAAQHAIENPFFHPFVGEHRVALTLVLLGILCLVFLKGFQEAIGLAAAVAIPYLALNLIVLGRCAVEVVRHPELLTNWRNALSSYGDWTSLFIASSLIFPKLALGLSGFETGAAVMPLIRDGNHGSAKQAIPLGRVRATRKMLGCAAAIMSVLLMLSSVMTTFLIPEEAYRIGGPASGRAIAYLAHSLLGSSFGTVYDLATIAILWFAGASAMAGLLHLIPRYLPRFGMAPLWVAYRRPLVIFLFGVATVVTLAFDAGVEAQAAAYATGVLALILSAAVAVTLALWRESSALSAAYFGVVTAVFAFTFIDNVIERPDGVVIAAIFIFLVILSSSVSRFLRSTELRVTELVFEDPLSAELWPSIVNKKVHLIPLRSGSATARIRKVEEIRKHYALEGSIAFLHINLADNRSEFLSKLRLSIKPELEHFVLEVSGATAIANTVAYLSELIDPKSIFLGLTRQNLMSQSFRYLIWGEGETGLMVYTILLKYWEETPEDDIRPRIFLMSE